MNTAENNVQRDAAPAIEVRELVKRYADKLALDYLNMNVRTGEIYGLLGPNGSGKTTAINCILGLLTYDSGQIRAFGGKMGPTAYDLKRRIGVVPQDVAVFNELTVQENIEYFCSLYVADKMRRARLVDEAIEFVGLEDYRRFRPRKLSGGLPRRLNIACGIVHQPEPIFFDEPTVAVDPQSRNAILEGIRRMNAQGCTVVYTSRYMEEVEEICSRIMIMDRGRSVAVGTNVELKALVGAGERIIVEVAALGDAVRGRLASLPHVRRVTYTEPELVVQCEQGGHNVGDVLGVLADAGCAVGRVYAEPPTLNDVFLEITGKELRD